MPAVERFLTRARSILGQRDGAEPATPSGTDHPIAQPFYLVSQREAAEFPRGRWQYCGYVAGQELRLLGSGDKWQGVQSLAIPYVLIPPAVTGAPYASQPVDRRTDAFLLPDQCRDALVAYGVLSAAGRVGGIDLAPLAEAARVAEADLLYAVLGTQRANSRVRRRNR